MSVNIIKTYSSKLGDKKGNKRIWLASKKLNETKLAENLRFEPFYDFENQRIVLKDRQWLTKENSNSIAYNLIKEQEHIRKGEGFRMGRTYVDQTLVGTITKGIYQNRLTDLVLVNPDNHEMFSKFTPRELARINGLPEDFKLCDNSMSTLGEIIGQGICYQPFNAVGKMIIEHLNSEEFDEAQYKLEQFKSSLKSANNNDYTDNQLACFMSGTLF